uniref:Uncharacterized protein n=1 Tax=Siphoviridae sp. ctgaY24 TaxID=2827911 RepID=A0A8S5SBC1_9CAUD|nr:MAG TPA: hypothetical protein [Siphoviridae sp. ctgaY24]DAW69466.1 MAG TPA: hypothetical protein [Caudoviricetes sp.]
MVFWWGSGIVCRNFKKCYFDFRFGFGVCG